MDVVREVGMHDMVTVMKQKRDIKVISFAATQL